MAGFTQLLEVVVRANGKLEGFTGGPSQAQEVWQELQPSLARVGRLKELVARISGDLSSLEKQVEQNDATFGAGAVIQLASLVLKSLLLLFTKQQKGLLYPPSSLPNQSFIVFSTKKTAMQFNVEWSRLGEWCEKFRSWQLHFTARHGLLYLQCSSEP